MPRLNSCNKLILSNTVLRYNSKSVSTDFIPSNLHSSYNNCGPMIISFSPAISMITVSNCFSQSSSCSRIGISFQSWLVKRRIFTSISCALSSKPYLVINLVHSFPLGWTSCSGSRPPQVFFSYTISAYEKNLCDFPLIK